MAWKYVVTIAAPDSATPQGRSEAVATSWATLNPTRFDVVGLTNVPGSVLESVHLSQFTAQENIAGGSFDEDLNF